MLRRGSLRHAAADPAVDAGRWRRAQHAGRRWAAWGALLGVAIGGISQLPAQWLANALVNATDGRLLLAEARGSLWTGSAVLVLTGGAGSRDAALLPGRLHWRLRPGWRGLVLAARQDCCLQGELWLRLQPGWRGYTLTLGDPAAAVAAPTQAGPTLGHWPAAWLAGLGTPWNTLQLGGQLQLASPGLQLQSVAGQLQFDGSLSLLLLNASSQLSTLPALGSYRVQLQGAGAPGEATRVQLSTLEGALRLDGSGSWSAEGLRFRGQAQAAEGQDNVLSNLLNIIGRRQGALSLLSIG